MLKPEDGFQKGRGQLKSEVAHLQRLLNRAGYALSSDGFYGPATETAVSDLQKKCGVRVSGTVDGPTWMALEKELDKTGVSVSDLPELSGLPDASGEAEAPESQKPTDSTGPDPSSLAGFRGQLEWILQQEGHAGKPYWPGGSSGVTLDPGFDLGHNDMETTAATYDGVLTQTQLTAVEPVIGLTGRQAKDMLNQSSGLLSIRISGDQALGIFPQIARPYWLAICKRMQGLDRPDTPGAVQTALLSLAFNRGYNNSGLDVLKTPIEDKDWHRCAELISTMQQDHSLEGIRARRQREGELIFNELRKSA